MIESSYADYDIALGKYLRKNEKLKGFAKVVAIGAFKSGWLASSEVTVEVPEEHQDNPINSKEFNEGLEAAIAETCDEIK